MKKQKDIFRIFLIGLTAIAGVLMMGSCRKASDNGKLDGQWQIMQIETLDDDQVRVPQRRVYICLNLHVVQLSSVGGISASGNMKYDKASGELNWDFPYHVTPQEISSLSEWGIYSNPVTLHVVKLDGKSMVLKSDKSVITCRRF